MASGQTVLQRTPLGLQISQELRRQILFGHLNPGTPLTQQDLCERFGTSRMPVRDAINMLVMDGLATRPNNRDAVVADITLKDILDAFEVNAHLHALAAVRAIGRGTADERDRLLTIHREMAEAVKDGNLPKSAELNGRFHRQLNRMSHSNPIITALKRVTAFVPDDFVKEAPDYAMRGYEEHESIMTAFLAGEGEKLYRMIIHHVMSVADHLVELLSDHRQEPAI
jgi:DNA-binding GntR family transcriptional regulator